MSRKRAATDSHTAHRDGNGVSRTWSGIALLCVSTGILCVILYVFACKMGYISVPSYLEKLLHLQERTTDTIQESGGTQTFMTSLPEGSSEETGASYTYYVLEDAEAKDVFAALTEPKSFQQKIRITEQYSAESAPRYSVVMLYRQEDCMRIETADSVVIFRGDSCYRGDSSGGSVFPRGKFTMYTEIGFPELQDVQAREDLTLTLQPEEKSVTAVYAVSETVWTLTYAVDSGLLTEMKIDRNGVRVYSMYTEQYAVYPTLSDGLFAFPSEE